jgi:hypothetical protein
MVFAAKGERIRIITEKTPEDKIFHLHRFPSAERWGKHGFPE